MITRQQIIDILSENLTKTKQEKKEIVKNVCQNENETEENINKVLSDLESYDQY